MHFESPTMHKRKTYGIFHVVSDVLVIIPAMDLKSY